MHGGDPTFRVLGDPELDRLIVALCYACQEFLKVQRDVCAIAMTMTPDGGIGVFHASVLDTSDWPRRRGGIEAELDAALAAGRFGAAGLCVNIADGDTYYPGQLPVLALRLLRAAQPPVHIRVAYRPLPDGTIRFGKMRMVNADGRDSPN